MSGTGDEGPRSDQSAVDSAQRTDAASPEVDWEALASPLRARLAELAAEAVGEIRRADVPPRLHQVMRFAPTKRAKLGTAAFVTALRDVPVFRAAVAEWVQQHRPTALDLSDADPLVVAAAALLRDDPVAPHYCELVAHRCEQGRLRTERDAAVTRAERMAAELAAMREEVAAAREAADRAGAESSTEADRLRKRLREQGMRLKEAKDAADEARRARDAARDERESELAEVTEERDRAREQAREQHRRAERAIAERDSARHSAREARQGDEVRLSLLLDTLEGAVGGLRRELGTSSRGPRPADAVRGARGPAGLTSEVADAAGLDRLLMLPTVHLIVDGYNVTKTGYPELPLADQRDRLAHQLAALAARTGAEVTVVFDGAEVVAVPTAGPRGVRVLFSDPGVLADDVIRSLVAAEPGGRQVVVATSDREVVTSVRQRGAYAVASAVLLAKLTRG